LRQTHALAALVFGLIRSNADGWGSSAVVGSLGAAAILMVVFVLAELLRAEPMLDLALLRVPTFNGGLAAAWAISASIFSLLTFLVLYLQNILGLSAVATGVRFLPLTGAIFLTAGIAGRLTARVSPKFLIGPGFLLVAGGMLLMRGLTPASGWSHLLPGMVLAGIGAGLVNVPLVSTAVGVVQPARAGMASGINSTLRQVAIATGVAGLGSLFASQVRASVIDHLAPTPLGAHAHQIAQGISSGGAARAITAAPGPLRGLVAGAARAGFVSGINEILLIGAIVALAGALTSFTLVRERDFITSDDGAMAFAG
jgi:predicted MFS family arabinose efflux permease